jgi:hypothetical protein
VSGDFEIELIAADGADDFVAYSDRATNAILTAPLRVGATPTTIAQGSPGTRMIGRRRNLLIWEPLDPAAPKGPAKLSVWSPKTPLTALGTSLRSGAGTASGDGTRVMFRQPVDATHTDIVEVVLADVAHPRVLKANVDDSCGSQVVGMAGSRFFTWVCRPDMKRGAVTFGPDGTEATLFPEEPIRNQITVRGSTAVAVVDPTSPSAPTRTLRASPVSGGPSIVIDTDVLDAFLSGDGSTVFYTTTAGALKRSSTTTPAPIVLVPSGMDVVLGISPDDRYAVVPIDLDLSAGPLSRLALVSLTAPGEPVPLVSTPTGAAGDTGGGFGATFTLDSVRALYYSDVVMAADGSSGLGTLHSVPVGGGEARVLGTNVSFVWELSGSHVLIEQGGADYGTDRDISFVDAARTDPPTLLAARATSWKLTPALDKLAYTPRTTPENQGIYILPLP